MLNCLFLYRQLPLEVHLRELITAATAASLLRRVDKLTAEFGNEEKMKSART